MGRLYNSDTAAMSWTFTISFLGYLFGAVVCGFIFDRINHNLLLMVASAVEAATTAVAPFFRTLPLFIATMTVQATSQGFIEASKARLCQSVFTLLCERTRAYAFYQHGSIASAGIRDVARHFTWEGGGLKPMASAWSASL